MQLTKTQKRSQKLVEKPKRKKTRFSNPKKNADPLEKEYKLKLNCDH